MTEPMPPTPCVPDTRRRRLLFRAQHRGTHEADLLLGRYVARHLDRFTADQLTALEMLLDLPDGAVVDWIIGHCPIPSDLDAPWLRTLCAEIRIGTGMGLDGDAGV